jgi:hypothetical protein
MAKFCYEWKQFNGKAMAVIEDAERLLNSYARQGYNITLRTLYYQFIARDLFPESRRDATLGTKNTEKNYKWLGKLVSDARIAGLLDWDHLQDAGREHHGGDSGWGEPRNIIRYGADNYNITRWDGQAHYVEVWVEKQALEDIVSRPCLRWNISYFACKGYVSQSSMHDASKRLKAVRAKTERDLTIIHLGDHDPSGIDMTRDIQDRMRMFGVRVKVVRIALNMSQVEQYDPPPSPAKITDSRAASYIEEFGDDSWELDALEPQILDSMIEDEITSRLDMSLWQQREDQETQERQLLVAMHSNYDEIVQHMRGEGMI